jgi:hypothetical protein
MNNAVQNLASATTKDDTSQRHLEYLPMDVYVDPRTIKAHFQCSSTTPKLAVNHPTTTSERWRSAA